MHIAGPRFAYVKRLLYCISKVVGKLDWSIAAPYDCYERDGVRNYENKLFFIKHN